MGRAVENPKKHIVSCRISDEEMQNLVELANRNGTSVSGLLRHSLGLLEQDGPARRSRHRLRLLK